jgi:hypothetical protein
MTPGSPLARFEPSMVSRDRPPRSHLADCNCWGLAAMAAIRARKLSISLRNSRRSGPRGSLRASSNNLEAIFSKSCIVNNYNFAMRTTTKFLLNIGTERSSGRWLGTAVFLVGVMLFGR